MSNGPDKSLIDIYLAEYEKLKDEQVARIGFRDNLIYATLIAVGSILSFALSTTTRSEVVLVIPLATVALGWTYLINDEKISALGHYVRTDLTERIGSIVPAPAGDIFGWERKSSGDKSRLWRKIVQFVVNEALFVLSGLVAVTTYLVTAQVIPALFWVVVIMEMVFLAVLAVEIAVYAEFKKLPDGLSSSQPPFTR
jgi:hypothetical protein